jgi:CHAD domain-containing protein
LKDELKWLAGSLGPARDRDVFAMNLLAPVRAVLHTERDLENLVEAANRRQQAAYEAARKAIESRRYSEIILKAALVRNLRLAGPAGIGALGTAALLHRRDCAALDRATLAPGDEAVQALRRIVA